MKFAELKKEILNESLIKKMLNPKMTGEVNKIVNDIQKKIGGKIKNESTIKDVNIVLSDPDLYGEYGYSKDDMKVDKIEFQTNKSYYPKIDMVYHFNDGLVVDEVIETANDAFEKFKDMS
jgi:hypothetical protein